MSDYQVKQQKDNYVTQDKTDPTQIPIAQTPQISQIFSTNYQPIMQKIKIMSPDEIAHSLQKINFYCTQLEQEKNDNQMRVSCVRTDFQSVVYNIKMGRIRGMIRVFFVQEYSKIFTPNAVSKGQYGNVSRIKFNNKQYALKNIKINQEKMPDIVMEIREVFLVKIASALEIGPHFQNIYGYDAIIYKDSLQFAMQYCACDYSKKQIMEQQENKYLFKAVKTLHWLGFCHCDIKAQNVARSSIFNKFILLDFGFTKIMKQPLGMKTLTNFVGTFSYASQQMRNIYLSGKLAFVDMYYNDLFCLLKTIEQISSQRKKLTGQIVQFPSKIQNQSSTQSVNSQFQQQSFYIDLQNIPMQSTSQTNGSLQVEFSYIIPFFKLKYYIFKLDFQNIEQLISHENKLPQTFKRMLFINSYENLNYKGYTKMQQIYHKYEQKWQKLLKSRRRMTKFDEILYNYLLKSEQIQKNTIYSRRYEKAVDMNLAQQFISKIWNQQIHMEQIFYFIDKNFNYESRKKITQNYQKRFVEQLYEYILQNRQNQNVSQVQQNQFRKQKTKTKSNSHTVIYRQVMITLFEYFQTRRNLLILQQILPYFILFDDYNNTIAQIKILRIYKQTNYQLYFLKNCEYFWCKHISIKKKIQIYDSDHIRNLVTICNELEADLQKFCQKHFFGDKLAIFVDFIRVNIQLMKFVQIGYFRAISRCKQKQSPLILVHQQIKKFLQNPACKMLGNQLLFIIRNFINFRCSYAQMTKTLQKSKGSLQTFIKSKFLKTCYIRAIEQRYLTYSLGQSTNFQLQQVFFSYYFPFENQFSLPQLFKKKDQIVYSLQQMNQNDNLILNQIEILLLYELNQDASMVQNFIDCQFANFHLHRIKTIRQVAVILNAFIRILPLFKEKQFINFCIFSFEDSPIKSKIINYAQNLIQWCAYFCELNFAIDYYDQHSKQMNQYYLDFVRFLHLELKMIVCYLRKQIDKTVQIVEQITYRFQFSNKDELLAEIYQSAMKQNLACKQKIQDIMLKQYQTDFQSKRNLGNCLINFKFTKSMILILSKRGKKKQAKILLQLYLSNAFQSNFLFTYIARQMIFNFMQYCQPQQLEEYLIQLAKRADFWIESSHTGISLLLYHLIFFFIHTKCIINESLVKRSLILCAVGFDKINHVELSIDKFWITKQMLVYFRCGRTVSLLKQLICQNQKNFMNLVHKMLNRIKKTKISDQGYMKMQKKLLKLRFYLKTS